MDGLSFANHGIGAGPICAIRVVSGLSVEAIGGGDPRPARGAAESDVGRPGLDRRSAHGTAVFASCLCFERPSLGIPLSAVAISDRRVARHRKPVREAGEAGGVMPKARFSIRDRAARPRVECWAREDAGGPDRVFDRVP
jgi:hypothetical protein